MTTLPPPPRGRRLLGTSLKMYFDLPSTTAYIAALAALAPAADAAGIDLFVIPDFVSLTAAQHTLAHTSLRLGAQNCSPHARGPYTGEVSPVVLKQAGVSLVELGHAERRSLFGETDADVAAKVAAVVRHGMVPLICIGEKSRSQGVNAPASHAVGLAVSECTPQVRAALSGIPDEAEVVLAYEPVWAIGAAEPAGADHVVAVVTALRGTVEGRKGRVRWLYGGSAGPGTFGKLRQAVDGLFLGRFAHDVKNVEQVIKEMSEEAS